ncbi:hypothetical protein [Alistipes sp.]
MKKKLIFGGIAAAAIVLMWIFPTYALAGILGAAGGWLGHYYYTKKDA